MLLFYFTCTASNPQVRSKNDNKYKCCHIWKCDGKVSSRELIYLCDMWTVGEQQWRQWHKSWSVPHSVFTPVLWSLLQPVRSCSSHITHPELNLTSLSFLDPDDWWSSLMINFAVIVNANVLDRSWWLGTRSKHKQASYSIKHLLIHNLGRL